MATIRWTCFHCDDTFESVETAREHFGATQDATPGCLLKVRGAELGLLAELRELEDQLARYMQDDTELTRAMHRMQARHSAALRTAEEAGYERGLRDGRSRVATP